MGSDYHAKYGVCLSDVYEAMDRIAPHIHRTPVMTSSSVDAELARSVFFKCEQLQRGGSFKFRGACNAVQSLTEAEVARGVVTHSSGNHGAALALAAKQRGAAAHIVVPNTSPRCKTDNVERYGGRLVVSESGLPAREEASGRVQRETGATFIAPFSDERILCGQATIALELLEQVPLLDAIIAPISGGGLVSGIAIAAKAINPAIKVIAAEPKGADDAFRSKQEGRLLKCEKPKTIADGLRSSMSSLTWPIVRDLVDHVILVEEIEIIAAMKMCFCRLKSVVEPSGASSLAALLSPTFKTNPSLHACKRVGVILSGGNVDMDAFWQTLSLDKK